LGATLSREQGNFDMTPGTIVLIVLVLAAIGYVLGKRRALQAAKRDGVKLHSLPSYYGESVALFTAVPALFLMAAWLFVQPIVIEAASAAKFQTLSFPKAAPKAWLWWTCAELPMGLGFSSAQGTISEDDLVDMRADLTNVRSRLAEVGVALGSNVEPAVFEAAKSYRAFDNMASAVRNIAVILAALALGFWAWRRITPKMRARNITETFIKALLMGSSLVAILTTVGIVASLLFESLQFFQLYPATKFYFSTVWNPQFRGGSDFGFLPLLWGTLYVSFIALSVAVPIGLMIAIYLAEYSGSALRSFAKPAIEVLAGIPTIVYGLFA
jgi:phosphate transport system permease protein